MSRYEIRQMRLSLLRTLLGCTGWLLFAICGMQTGWLNDFWGTAVLIVCTVVAGLKMDRHTRKMERRWMV